LHVFLSDTGSGYSREDGATYYSNGVVASGQYAGDQVILVSSYPEGPAFRPDMHRFIKDGDTLILIAASSSDTYTDDGFDTSKFIVNTNLALSDLSYPDKITGTAARETFARDQWTHPVFNASKVTKIFTHPTYGDVYTTKGYPEPTSVDDFSTYGFFIKRADGFTEVYSLDIDFVNDQEIPDITWNDTTKNETMYSYATQTGCGSSSYADVMDPSVLPLSTLQQMGTNSFGDPIYELKDNNNSLLKDLYNNDYYPGYQEDKISYDTFVTQHPMFFWHDPFDRLIRFKNNSFLPQAECGKPVIYLYPKQTTDISVHVDPVGGMTYSDPEYSSGWNVSATPESELTDLASGLRYPYLFWEGKGGIYAQPTKGWSVARHDVHSFLNEKLAAFGLNQKEISDFEEFWEPRMQNAPYYFVSFLDTRVMNELAPLHITPQPDTVIRVLMDFSPLDAPIDVEGFTIHTPQRTGFTVTEWGGVIQ